MWKHQSNKSFPLLLLVMEFHHSNNSPNQSSYHSLFAGSFSIQELLKTSTSLSILPFCFFPPVSCVRKYTRMKRHNMSLANSPLSMSAQRCHHKMLKLPILGLLIYWLYLITYVPCTIHYKRICNFRYLPQW